MTSGQPRDVAASISRRLLNRARELGEDYQAILMRYALERFLYRLSTSAHRDEMVLKGAMLFVLWSGKPHRATWDLDLLGAGAAEPARLGDLFRAVCTTLVPDDGLIFDLDTIRAAPIREDQVYQGVRVEILARLGKARIRIQIDVGFGDAVVPAPTAAEYPTLLNQPAPRVRTYPREVVIAEKFQAMIALGIANSRMKDFYDLWTLARTFAFEGATLQRSLAATFARRQTPLPTSEPMALSLAFAADPAKQKQWTAFVRKSELEAAAAPLAEVTSLLREFVLPPALAAASREVFRSRWPAGGPWTKGR